MRTNKIESLGRLRALIARLPLLPGRHLAIHSRSRRHVSLRRAQLLQASNQCSAWLAALLAVTIKRYLLCYSLEGFRLACEAVHQELLTFQTFGCALCLHPIPRARCLQTSRTSKMPYCRKNMSKPQHCPDSRFLFSCTCALQNR